MEASGSRAKGRGWAPALMILLAALSVGGCKKGPDGNAKRIPRDNSIEPVVVVEAPGPQAVPFAGEIEPNNAPEQAMSLALGTGVRGALDGETDVDLYRVTAAEAGPLQIELSGIEGVDLVLELRDSQGNVLVHSDRGPAKMTEGIPNVVVDKGEYLVGVREFVKKRRGKAGGEPRVGLSPLYELVVGRGGAPERHHEVEPNGSMEQAAEVLIGDEVYGYMGWNKDEDFWKLSIEGFSSQYSLDLDIDPVPEVSYRLVIFDSDGKPLVKRSGDKGTPMAIRNLVVVSEPGAGEGTGEEAGAGDGANDGAGEPRYIYARLSARRSNPSDKYRLRMTSRLLEPDEELEPNDKPDDAGELTQPDGPAEGVRRGSLTAGDVDHYRVSKRDEPMVLSVTAKPVSDNDLVLQVLVDGALAGEANAARGGGAESLPDMALAAGKTALVVIRGKGAAPADGAYELRWVLEPAAGLPLPADLSGAADFDGDPAGRLRDDPADDSDLLDDYNE